VSWDPRSARPGRPAALVMEPSATDGSMNADQSVTGDRAADRMIEELPR
jgi:hypothetical protein